MEKASLLMHQKSEIAVLVLSITVALFLPYILALALVSAKIRNFPKLGSSSLSCATLGVL